MCMCVCMCICVCFRGVHVVESVLCVYLRKVCDRDRDRDRDCDRMHSKAFKP